MRSYLLLLAPSASRVYAAAAPALAAGELAVLLERVLGEAVAPEPVEVAGVPYLAFATTADPAAVAGAASSTYALHAVEGDLLRPVAMPRPDRYADDLLTIQKYPGKTNEQFTHLLLNLTLAATDDPDLLLRGGFRLVDPVCGRGTTLNRGLVSGAAAVAGVDVDRKDVESYAGFLRQWAKDHRLPHTADLSPVRRHKQTVAHRFAMTLHRDRAEQKAGRGTSVDVVCADTATVREWLPGRYDVLVGDLPYGVEHGSRAGGGLSRRPGDLLDTALSGWVSLLRPGGALGLSFNTRTLRRDDLLARVRDAGLVPADLPDLTHRVDSSIHRDLVVAAVRR